MRWISLIFILLLASCSPFYFNPEGYEILSESLDEAWPKSAALAYIPDENDYWQSPHETEDRGGGDCEDLAVYLMYFLGEDSEFVAVQLAKGRHALVRYRGMYLEPHKYGTTYNPSEIEPLVVVIYSYNAVMTYSTHYGTLAITGDRR